MIDKNVNIYDWKVNINDKELKDVVDALDRGELIVFPTETVYGIGADASNNIACSKIFKVKGRPADNPLIVHVSDIEMLETCVKNVSEVEKKLIDAFMPGPFTLILEKQEWIPNEVTAGLDTVAIRMPNHPIANRVISEFGKPIAAPSANKSGRPSGTRVADIKEELGDGVFALIDGGYAEIGVESTVVRVLDDIPVILRPGAVTAEEILSIVGEIRIDEHVLNEVKIDEKVLSPGMKHTHYSPRTKCVLINIDDDQERIDTINLFSECNACFLGIGRCNPKIEVLKYVSLGDSLEEVSKNIFTMLREADSFNCDLILIQSVEPEGLGLAIMNRLIRTCGYNIIYSYNQAVQFYNESILREK